MGVIFLRQGKLPEAEAALRAELKSEPLDLKSRRNLAMILEQEQKPDEALALLDGVLKMKPDSAGDRYLKGKILLAQGHSQEAITQLAIAARLDPEDPDCHLQLAQAYQKLGRGEDSAREFENFRTLKAKKREVTP
jgi:predicted Zn-dependent protease